MNWDPDVIAYSAQTLDRAQRPDSTAVIQSKFRQFLREFQPGGGIESTFYYRERLQSNYQQRNYQIIVDFEHLNTFDDKLAQSLRENPMNYLPIFEDAAQEVVAQPMVPRPQKADMQVIQVQIVNCQRDAISVRKLSSTHISQLVTIPGIIISSTKPSCKATKITLKCTNCGTTIDCRSARAFGSVMLPRRCENASNPNNEMPCPMDPFIILPDKSDFLDIQKLKLQETPEAIPTGEMPRHIWLFAERKLVNKVKPGARVNIIGIYKIFDSKVLGRKNDRYDVSVRKPYVEIVGIEEHNAADKRGTWLPEEEDQIRELSRKQHVYRDIAKSIAPAIWGNEDIKKAIACLLFGGSRKYLNDGMKLRGDINVLLLGDPSVAKSQFLKFVHEVAPIAVYTSGKGSSAAGLTASVLKDPGTGEFHLEGGAMVLADGGVVCIDEFDKMREQDRVAIHEAMEQQTISIAKAGITTILNSRTSVLAAANPVFGRYDDLRSTSENIDFETTILSRFDLIFIIRDIKDVDRDTRLAHHIMDLHINISGNSSSDANNAPISPDMLARYIAYGRHRIHPRLTHNASEMLKNHYVNFRQDAKKREIETGEQSAIPLTVRQLESLVRIAESIAKMELSTHATEDHVKEAVRLFKVATLRAAKQGIFNGEGAFASQQFVESIQKAERNISRRLPIGSSTSVSKLIQEMARRNIQEAVTRRALDIMHGRGDIDYRARRRQVYRVK